MSALQNNDRSFKRSIDGIFTVIANLKNRDDKPLKSAIYNVGLLIMLFAFMGVVMVLLPFISPLFWALLFGAVLFPIKKKISFAITNWIRTVEKNEMPLALEIIMAPVHGVQKLGELIIREIVRHRKVLFIGICSIIALRIIYLIPADFTRIFSFLLWIHVQTSFIISHLSLTLLIILIVSYMFALNSSLWCASSAKAFTLAGHLIWLLIAAYFCSFLGACQIPALIGVVIYSIAGLFYNEESQENVQFVGYIKKLLAKEPKAAEPEATASTAANNPPPNETVMTPMLKTKQHLQNIKQKMELNLEPGNKETPTKESDLYFKFLLYACTATMLWHHLWIVFLCFIPITLYALKELCSLLGFRTYMTENGYYAKLLEWYNERHNALVPACLPGCRQINFKLHTFFISKLNSFVHDVSAMITILFLILVVIFLGIFFSFQIYSETITVAKLGSDLVNMTLTLRPDLVEMLPINMQSMDSVIDDTYKYGREKIQEYLEVWLNETKPEQANKLKEQILSVWDRLVQSYMDQNNSGMGPRVSSESVFDTIDEIVNTSTSVALNWSGLFAWAQKNIGMLMEIGDSIWIILKANMSLLLSLVTTLSSAVLLSGHVMITFVFNSVIFFTTLYYLLQSSNDRYVPIALNINSSLGKDLANALEESVSSVLVATIKITMFHFMFTWLTHSVFGAQFVYLPAILTAVLAAAPFLEVYWCALPAFLDLWLSQDRFYSALTLIIIHVLIPTNFNPIVHSEIKGSGHPYLTGLSIVGGLYLFGGIQGAVLGPLLLCLLIGLSSIAVSSLNSNPNTFTPMRSSNEESLDYEFAKRSIRQNLDTTM